MIRLPTAGRSLMRGTLIALAMGAFFAPAPVIGEPMKVENRDTVYQRVLTKRGAPRSDSPDGAVTVQYAPFLPLYVFARENGWVQVGPSATADPEGWLPEDSTVPWKQNIVAAFTNPANRSRQLLFDTEGNLDAFLNHEALQDMLPTLVEEADRGAPRPEAGVVVVEPEEHINIDENFYIMPILEVVEAFHPLSMGDNLLMNVASLPLDDQAPQPQAEDYDVGVVFVVDTTSSMEPYFPLMREALQRLVTRIDGTDVGKRVNFGIVAFQDVGTGLDYRVSEILPLKRRDSQDPVLDALGAMRDADANSPGFNEDSLAAVDFAMTDVDWTGDGRPFGGKYILLVTDAGPKLPRAGPETYDLLPEDLQTSAEDEGFGLVTLHLKTRSGSGNHDFAKQKYEELTRFEGVPRYFAIEGGDPEAFTDEAERLASFFIDSVNRALNQDTLLDDDETGEDLLGLDAALRLRYLGTVRDTAAPDVVRGWVSQYAAEDPARKAISFRLLVTRNELASIADLTEGLIAAAEQLATDADLEAYHNQIRSLILRMSQNPDRIVNPSAEAPGDALEFLRDLPYRSRVLRTTEDRWMENPGERREIIDGLYSKLAGYRRRLNAPEVWQQLFPAAPDGEHVTTIPIEFLP